MSARAIRRLTHVYYEWVPEIVEAQPLSPPNELAERLLDVFSDAECRELLVADVAQRIRTAQIVRSNSRHDVSVHQVDDQ